MHAFADVLSQEVAAYAVVHAGYYALNGFQCAGKSFVMTDMGYDYVVLSHFGQVGCFHQFGLQTVCIVLELSRDGDLVGMYFIQQVLLGGYLLWGEQVGFIEYLYYLLSAQLGFDKVRQGFDKGIGTG